MSRSHSTLLISLLWITELPNSHVWWKIFFWRPSILMFNAQAFSVQHVRVYWSWCVWETARRVSIWSQRKHSWESSIPWPFYAPRHSGAVYNCYNNGTNAVCFQLQIQFTSNNWTNWGHYGELLMEISRKWDLKLYI